MKRKRTGGEKERECEILIHSIERKGGCGEIEMRKRERKRERKKERKRKNE
jgi:uncharacterized protein with von Willebrand factor type A (vWA) domain